MLGFFRKKTTLNELLPREERVAINEDVYIKRIGQTTLRSNQGNISEGGLYVYIPNHDLERGKKVEIVLVSKKGALRQMNRMMGIVIRSDEAGVAMVTYKKHDMNSQVNLRHEERMLQKEFGEF